MDTQSNDRTFTAIVIAPIVRKLRFFVHTRKDKLQLILLMIAGSIVPVFLCWGLPTLVNSVRINQEQQALIAAEIDQETFRENHADLVALCDTADANQPSGVLPADPRVIIMRGGDLDQYQDTAPSQWRAQSPEQANVLLCLGRETALSVESCIDGSTPDLSMFVGYELYIGLERDFAFARNHPEVSGRTLLRYLTDYSLINSETGEVIDAGQISGSDPRVCYDPPEVSPIEVYTGEALRQEVLFYINGERLTTEGFNDWLTAELSK